MVGQMMIRYHRLLKSEGGSGRSEGEEDEEGDKTARLRRLLREERKRGREEERESERLRS